MLWQLLYVIFQLTVGSEEGELTKAFLKDKVAEFTGHGSLLIVCVPLLVIIHGKVLWSELLIKESWLRRLKCNHVALIISKHRCCDALMAIFNRTTQFFITSLIEERWHVIDDSRRADVLPSLRSIHRVLIVELLIFSLNVLTSSLLKCDDCTILGLIEQAR